VSGELFKSDAFLLRSVDFRDSDRILTLLTRERGKLSALARGARKSQKRYGGALVPFAHIEVVLTQGRGKLLNITEATLYNPNTELSTHLERVGAASYVTEIIRESIPENLPDIPLFELLKAALPLIARVSLKQIVSVVVAVTLKILEINGIAVRLDRCSACGKPVPRNRPVLFHPARGGVVCTRCGGGPLRLEADTIDGLIRLCQLSIHAVPDTNLSPQAAQQGEEALAAFMEHHWGRPLKTRAYFQRSMH
jgi:DNA repair protein RecO (recombination protein O)